MARYLTETVPPVPGRIKDSPEDFLVEEIPLYVPGGEGEHLYLFVEKEGITTLELIRRLSRIFDVPEREIGYAGMKDSRARTRQYISLLKGDAARVAGVQDDRFRILDAKRHRNKLRLGHLAGNRFSIRIAGSDSRCASQVEEVLRILATQGMPNFFGEQRYGVLGNSHLIGRAILVGDFETAVKLVAGDPDKIDDPAWHKAALCAAAGDWEGAAEAFPRRMRPEQTMARMLAEGKPAKKAFSALGGKLQRLFVNACQSHLFDRLVDLRMESLGQLMAGDVAMKHLNGACFRVADPAVEQGRADTFEISPTAPLFAPRVMLAEGEPGSLEQQVLVESGLELDCFADRGRDLGGERRPLRVPVGEPSCSWEGDEMILGFTLPKGSYATSLIREILKSEVADASGD